MPSANSRSFAQLVAGRESETSPEAKSGRGKPAKDPHKNPNNVHFEPFEQRAYDMSYACLLIPRNPEHLLTGKVADFVHKAISITCAAFGWSLMMVQVRPEYVQWIISATVGTPPSKCIHTIREQTSRGILDKFKEFQDGSEYQDFWAPGYLVLVSAEAHPPNIIEEFIVLTRQQQGLPRHGA